MHLYDIEVKYSNYSMGFVGQGKLTGTRQKDKEDNISQRKFN
jgi:hypothetical protein